jgi:hypothetical protein
MTPDVPSRESRPADRKLRELSPQRQRLVKRAQDLGFGRFERLVIRRGEPVLDGPEKPRVVRTFRAGRALGRRNDPRPQAAAEDFALRQEVVDLLTWLDGFDNGVIDRLEVVAGLPSYWDAEELVLPA